MRRSDETKEAGVFIIDDEEAVRHSLAALFRSACLSAETYPDAEAFLRATPGLALRGGCVVTDLRMPGMDGTEIIGALRSRGVTLPVVVITGHGDIAMAVRAMKAGAFDFIEKPFDDESILATVRGALECSAMQPSRDDAGEDSRSGAFVRAADRIAALSPREREVLALLTAGRQNKMIAHELGLSPRTVEMHRARMMERLGVRSLSEAIRLAIMADLAPPRVGPGPVGLEEPTSSS